MKYFLENDKLYYIPDKGKKKDAIEYIPFNSEKLDWNQLQKEIQKSLNTLMFNVLENGQATPINLDTLASIYVKKMQKFSRELIKQELENNGN